LGDKQIRNGAWYSFGVTSRLLIKNIRNEVLLFSMRESVFPGKGFLLTFSMTFKQTE